MTRKGYGQKYLKELFHDLATDVDAAAGDDERQHMIEDDMRLKLAEVVRERSDDPLLLDLADEVLRVSRKSFGRHCS